LKSNKTSQPIKKFSFITNLITSTKTIEDMSNQDQTLNSETKSIWVLKMLRVIAIQFMKTRTFGRINNILWPKCKLWTLNQQLTLLLQLAPSNQILPKLMLLLHVVSLLKVYSTILFKLSMLQLKPS
jgi:hypothetical protein